MQNGFFFDRSCTLGDIQFVCFDALNLPTGAHGVGYERHDGGADVSAGAHGKPLLCGCIDAGLPMIRIYSGELACADSGRDVVSIELIEFGDVGSSCTLFLILHVDFPRLRETHIACAALQPFICLGFCFVLAAPAGSGTGEALAHAVLLDFDLPILLRFNPDCF